MKRLLNTLYITNQDAYLRKHDDAIAVYLDGEKAMSVPFHLLEGIVLFGHAGCSTALLGVCAQRGITTAILDERGRFQARVEGPISGNVLLRKEQYRRAASEEQSLLIAQRFVLAKIHNARMVLQHYLRDYPALKSEGVKEVCNDLADYRKEVLSCTKLDTLRGVEGNAAHIYFSSFGSLLRTSDIGTKFTKRSRRPPLDPVNATLSLVYTLLTRDVVSACETVGLDPQLGYLHACRPGRMSLALDLVEELRAPVADRFVLSLFNRRQIDSDDFRKEGTGCYLKENALKEIVRLWQEKKHSSITHPFLGEKIPMGLLPFVQAQLFARYLRGDLDDYPAMLWR